MAVGIAVAGGGVGTLVLGPSLEVVIQSNGWRSALRILSLLFGICVPICAIPFVVVPIVATDEGVKDNEDDNDNDKNEQTTKQDNNRKEGSLLEDDRMPVTPSIKTVVVVTPSTPSALDKEPLSLIETDTEKNTTIDKEIEKPKSSSNIHENKNTQEDHGYLPLLKIRALVLALIGVSLYSGASFTIVMHGVTFAGEAPPNGPGMLAIQAATLTSYQGIANTVGRIVFGRLADTPGWSRLIVMQIILGISGLCCIGLALAPTNGSYLIFYMVVYGLTAGSVVSTFSSVVGDLVPPKSFAMGLGLANFSQAPVILLAPVLAGWIREISGSYVIVWWGVSVAMFGGSIIMSPSNVRLILSYNTWKRVCCCHRGERKIENKNLNETDTETDIHETK